MLYGGDDSLYCFPQLRTFIFEGADAVFAKDGIVEVQVHQNSDAIALDYARLTVAVEEQFRIVVQSFIPENNVQGPLLDFCLAPFLA